MGSELLPVVSAVTPAVCSSQQLVVPWLRVRNTQPEPLGGAARRGNQAVFSAGGAPNSLPTQRWRLFAFQPAVTLCGAFPFPSFSPLFPFPLPFPSPCFAPPPGRAVLAPGRPGPLPLAHYLAGSGRAPPAAACLCSLCGTRPASAPAAWGRGQGTRDRDRPCAGCPCRGALRCLLQPLQPVPALVLSLVLGEQRALSCTLLWEQRLRPWRGAWCRGAWWLRPVRLPRCLLGSLSSTEPLSRSGMFFRLFFFLVSATNMCIPKRF